jgi:putative MATE family efflux protein
MPAPPSLLVLPERRAIWMLAWPTIVLGLLRSGYFLANSFWVAGMGKDALAAIGGAAFAVWTTFSLTELGATGVYSQVAQAVGAGDLLRARRALGHGLVLAGLLGIVLAALLFFGRNAYFDLLNMPDGDARTLGLRFLAITALGAPASTLLTTLTAAFRGVGNTRLPMWIYATTLLSNVIIDPVLIYGVGPIPGMGIGGAALATMLANAVGVLLCWKGLTRLGYAPRIDQLELGWLGRIATIGLPIAISGLGFDTVYMFLAREINRFGPAALAAVGLGHRIESLGFQACIGFQVAATTLVGQWMGAGQPHRAEQAAREVRRHMLRVLLPISAVVAVFAPWFIAPFSSDPEVLAYGTGYLRLNGAVMGLMGLEILYEGAFSGTGKTLPALLIAFPLTAARIPASHLLAVNAGLGATGIWLVIALSTTVKGLLMNGWFARGGWKDRLTTLPEASTGATD